MKIIKESTDNNGNTFSILLNEKTGMFGVYAVKYMERPFRQGGVKPYWQLVSEETTEENARIILKEKCNA